LAEPAADFEALVDEQPKLQEQLDKTTHGILTATSRWLMMRCGLPAFRDTYQSSFPAVSGGVWH